MATPGSDDTGGPQRRGEISELRRTAKWRFPPEEIEEEDDLLTGEELKLCQSVAARFNFLAVDRSDLLYSVKELMRKMGSPRIGDLIALKRVVRCTIKYLRMACKYLWAPSDSNTEVFGDANFARCISGRSVCESEVQNDGSSGPELWRIRTGRSCQGRNRRFSDCNQF